MLRYSLEVPGQGTSNEYHNVCFCGEVREILCGLPLKSYEMSIYLILGVHVVNGFLCSKFSLIMMLFNGLMLSMLGKNSADNISKYFSVKIGFGISCKLSP